MTGPHAGPAETGPPAQQVPTPWHPQAMGSPAPQWAPPAGPPMPGPPMPGPPSSWPPPQARYGQPDAPPYAPAGPVCRICGGTPALACTVRGHVGMIIIMSWRSVPGPFCRTCGTAALRQMTASTLALGWWGPISLVVGTPFALISNLVTAQRLRSLPPPGPHGPQLALGPPVHRRPMAYVPVAVVLLIIVLTLVF